VRLDSIRHLSLLYPRPREGEEIPVQFIDMEKKLQPGHLKLERLYTLTLLNRPKD